MPPMGRMGRMFFFKNIRPIRPIGGIRVNLFPIAQVPFFSLTIPLWYHLAHEFFANY
jgi:hypothetical protein